MRWDCKDKINVNTLTNTNLESGLLIYNTNNANGNAKEPYFWYNFNSTEGAWIPFVNSSNKDVLLNLNYSSSFTIYNTRNILNIKLSGFERLIIQNQQHPILVLK